MSAVTWIVLVAFVAWTKAKDSIGKVADKLVDRLAERVQESFGLADLDDTTLGKPGHVATPSRARVGAPSPRTLARSTHWQVAPSRVALAPSHNTQMQGRRMHSCTMNWEKIGAPRGSQTIARAEVQGALLCDCDGTLVETERDGHRISFNKAFKEKGYENCDWTVDLYGELLTTGGGKERMTRYFTDYNSEAWKKLHPNEAPAKDHPAIMDLHKRKTALFMEIVKAGELPLREGVKDLLAAADAAGWTVAVCSTSQEAAVTAVVETMLPQYAPKMRIFAGDMAKKKKPDPEIYNMASKELNIPPSKCVVLEDTNIGMDAGKAAGMAVIVTKSIYSKDEDFGKADIVASSAAEVNFKDNVVPLLDAYSQW